MKDSFLPDLSSISFLAILIGMSALLSMLSSAPSELFLSVRLITAI